MIFVDCCLLRRVRFIFVLEYYLLFSRLRINETQSIFFRIIWLFVKVFFFLFLFYTVNLWNKLFNTEFSGCI